MGLSCFDDPEADDQFFDCEEDWEEDEPMLPPEEPAPEPLAAADDGNLDPLDDREYLEALLPEADQPGEPTAAGNVSAREEPPCLADMPAMKLRRLSMVPNESESTTVSTGSPTAFQEWLGMVSVEHTEEVVSKQFWKELTGTQVYNYLYDKLRSFYALKLHHRRPEVGDSFLQKSGKVRQAEARRALMGLSVAERRSVVAKWIEVSKVPNFISDAATAQFKLDEDTDGGRKQKSKGVLFTWMLTQEFHRDMSLPPSRTFETVVSLVGFLRGHDKIRAAWDEIREHGQTVKKKLGGTDVSICLEVCPETFRLQQVIRLHVHCFVLSTNRPMVWKPNRVYHLFGSAPSLSTNCPLGGSSKGRNLWSGFLYCCMPEKKGTVCCDSTKAPYEGFMVNANWIMNYVQSGKLCREVARKMLVRVGTASRLVKELDNQEAEIEREAIAEARRAAEIMLARETRPVKSYPEVQSFMQQFSVAQHRYKFLVLAGQSRVGKTEFARTLCDPGYETLEINCAGGAEPDLRAYRLSRHGLILFDEIVASQVTNQRKLFQAGHSEVQLGCSATNCHSYPVFVWRKKMVLASNCWHESVASLPPDAMDWIKQNCIVLNIKEKMYYE